MKILKQIFCKHTVQDIIVHDYIYDAENDNDDLEDTPTYIKITYCPKCGKLLNISDDEIDTFPFDCSRESSMEAIQKFESITHKDIHNILIDRNHG